MADITKQSYEEFRIHADFGFNMEAGETLLPIDSSEDSSAANVCNVKCWDKDNNDVTDELLDIDTMAIVDGNDTDDADAPGSGMPNAALQVLIRGGSEDAEPYKFTFYGVTSLDPPNKWERDITLRIRER